MRTEELLMAIGEVGEHFLEESERYSERPRIIRKWAVSAASLLLLTSLVLVPIKNGALGCGSTAPPDEHTHLFYDSIEAFTEDVGKHSLLANLSYEAGEIADYEMECIYYKYGGDLASYYCTYRLTDAEDVIVAISFKNANYSILAEGEQLTLHGYDVVITQSDEVRTKLDIYTDDGKYTVSVSGPYNDEIAMQIADDLLTEE